MHVWTRGNELFRQCVLCCGHKIDQVGHELHVCRFVLDNTLADDSVCDDDCSGVVRKFVLQDIVVGSEGDGSADVADCKSDGGDGGNEFIRTDYLGDD